MNAVRIGCSGWNYSSWRGGLYPQGLPARRWLELYAEHFDTVEVNSTFYRLARRPAVEAWARDTPDGFAFAVKASRYLTHVKRLTDLDRGFHRFYEPLAPLIEAGKLGPVLWQLPESFHRDDERLQRWLEALESTPSSRHTIEFGPASPALRVRLAANIATCAAAPGVRRRSSPASRCRGRMGHVQPGTHRSGGARELAARATRNGGEAVTMTGRGSPPGTRRIWAG